MLNYQKDLDKILAKLTREGKVPTLLLHSCCAPCSSYVLEYLSEYFRITVLYYNPNISPAEEYEARSREQERLISQMQVRNKVLLEIWPYDPGEFNQMAKGLEQEPEGGERCHRCYRLRLEKTAELARKKGFDYFTTTLSISPLKNAQWLNEIGMELEQIYQVPYLVSDFKKRDGYHRSVILSEQYHLYRQNYCGCVFSKNLVAK